MESYDSCASIEINQFKLNLQQKVASTSLSGDRSFNNAREKSCTYLRLLRNVQVCTQLIKTSSAYIPKGPKYQTMSSSCPNKELYPHIATILLLHCYFVKKKNSVSQRTLAHSMRSGSSRNTGIVLKWPLHSDLLIDTLV